MSFLNTRKNKKKKEFVYNEDFEEEESNDEELVVSKTNVTETPKKTLKVVSVTRNISQDQYSSATSFDADEEAKEQTLSIFKKFLTAPLKHSKPRTAVPKPCWSEMSTNVLLPESKTFLSAASSSKQLFEIHRQSPTPSDVDLNLISATYMRKLDAVKGALLNGANINTIRDQETPLLIATEIGDVQMVKFFLTVPKINIDVKNGFGQTPLIVAVKNSFEKITRLLLNYNGNVNLADHMGKTPLHYALFHRGVDIAKLLLAYGADVEKEDCFGERPMYIAAIKRPDKDCLALLLKVGASPEFFNFTGMNFLSRAILNWVKFDTIQMLVKYGASVNTADLTTKKTPLHFAAVIDDIKTAEFLVKEGADINAKTIYNTTPFQEAVYHKSLKVADYLVPLTKNASLKLFYELKKKSETDKKLIY